MVSLAERLRNTKEKPSASQSNTATVSSITEDPFASFESNRPSTSGSFGLSQFGVSKALGDDDETVEEQMGNNDTAPKAQPKASTSGLAMFKRGPKKDSTNVTMSQQLPVKANTDNNSSTARLNTEVGEKESPENDTSFMPPPPPRPTPNGATASKVEGMNLGNGTPLRHVPFGGGSQDKDTPVDDALSVKQSHNVTPYKEDQNTSQKLSQYDEQEKTTLSSSDHSTRRTIDTYCNDENGNQLYHVPLTEQGHFADTPNNSMEENHMSSKFSQGTDSCIHNSDCLGRANATEQCSTSPYETSEEYANQHGKDHAYCSPVQKASRDGASINKEIVTSEVEMQDGNEAGTLSEKMHNVAPIATPIQPPKASLRLHPSNQHDTNQSETDVAYTNEGREGRIIRSFQGQQPSNDNACGDQEILAAKFQMQNGQNALSEEFRDVSPVTTPMQRPCSSLQPNQASQHATTQPETTAMYTDEGRNVNGCSFQGQEPSKEYACSDKEIATPENHMQNRNNAFSEVLHNISPVATPMQTHRGSLQFDTPTNAQKLPSGNEVTPCSLVTPEIQDKEEQKTLQYAESTYNSDIHGNFDEMLTAFLTDLQDVKDRHNINDEEMLEMDVQLDLVNGVIQEEILQMQEMEDTLDELEIMYEEIFALSPSLEK